MVTREQLPELMRDMESDRVERTTSFREDKLGPAVCAFANDFPDHKKPGYLLLGVNDDGTTGGIRIGDEQLQNLGNVRSNGNLLPQPQLVVSPVFSFPEGSDYRNPLIAMAMKVLGYVNRFNYGVKNAQQHLAQNGNPEAEFQLGLQTKFSVTIRINREWDA